MGKKTAEKPELRWWERGETQVRCCCLCEGQSLQLAPLPAGRYVRSNLNMPPSLPQRSGGFRDYEKDAPITVLGCTQARLVGECCSAGTAPCWLRFGGRIWECGVVLVSKVRLGLVGSSLG